jgi:hypothetical protein
VAVTGSHSQEQPRVGFACVTENRSDWAQKTHNLALSVRTFGGPAASAPIVVNIVDGIGDRFRRLLEPLDVTLRQVERFDDRFPHANKLRMFDDLEPFANCDVLVALDCDILVADDPAPLISQTHIRAKAEDSTILTEEHWLAVYERFGMEPPAMDCVMTSTGQVTFPWWNSGVVNVPLSLAERLRARWGANVARVGKIHEETPPVLPATWITDQMAFVLTLLELGLPFDPFPIWGNTPTCFPVQSHLFDAEPGWPIFVHYHHHIARDGFLRPSGTEVIDERVDAMNRARAGDLGLEYKGLADLETPPSAPVRAWTSVQSRLKRQGWYKSPAARKAKRAVVNLLPRKGA